MPPSEARIPRYTARIASPRGSLPRSSHRTSGFRITPKIARELFAAGVDVITLGNHTYRHREIYSYLDEEERILRPANFLRGQPGHGWCVVAAGGVRLGVVSLSGNLYMNAGRP